MGTCVKEG
jgi:hypothetical protein